MPGDADGEETTQEPDPQERPREAPVERFLALSLRLNYIPVAVLLVAGLGAFVYGTVVFVHSVGQIVDHPFPVSHEIGEFLVGVDLFLIGATLLIAAVGFYELFIGQVGFGPDDRMPRWLEMRDLNDLKGRIIAMIVLVLAVSFVEVVVDLPSGRRVLDFGAGIALVMVALTIFARLGHGGSES
jgi:uncharacterized membrane protein YqhA